MTDDAIQDILAQTESDPAFQALFDLFDCGGFEQLIDHNNKYRLNVFSFFNKWFTVDNLSSLLKEKVKRLKAVNRLMGVSVLVLVHKRVTRLGMWTVPLKMVSGHLCNIL